MGSWAPARPGRLRCNTAGRWGVEATAGFEPANRGFADPPLRPLGYVALCVLAAPRGFEPRFTDPKSAVLPLDEGAATPRPREREWSGRRDSNPRPSHWQCDALPTEPLPPVNAGGGAESQIRTGDTALFRRVLYQLSYLGPSAACHGDLEHQQGQDTLHRLPVQRRGENLTCARQRPAR